MLYQTKTKGKSRFREAEAAIEKGNSWRVYDTLARNVDRVRLQPGYVAQGAPISAHSEK